MRKPFILIPVLFLMSCSDGSTKTSIETNHPATNCEGLVDSLKSAMTIQTDSILKLTQIIDEQTDSILKLNGGVKADDYEENSTTKDSLSKK